MEKRVVIPELLDHLPADDPAAQRSRRDLRRINFLMGNERWVHRTARSFPEAARVGIVEIGAGDGALSHRLANAFPTSPVHAYDLAPRPLSLNPRVDWHRGDVFSSPPPAPGGMVVANLFLHHFERPALRVLGEWLGQASVLIINEPDRAVLPHLLGYSIFPWINHVTRHDMQVSITAGFAAGEIPAWLGLGAERWEIRESSTWRGARRVVACRV